LAGSASPTFDLTLLAMSSFSRADRRPVLQARNPRVSKRRFQFNCSAAQILSHQGAMLRQ
jgi:hypothetical protein